MLKKPEWLRIQLPHESQHLNQLQSLIRRNGLHSVCEEASCPNIIDCFNQGKVTFLILGNICTRRCPFCAISHGRPLPSDKKEPQRIAQTINKLHLRYIVLTSVNRDDLHDGGAQHFVDCIVAIRKLNPIIRIEILVPDFRGCLDKAMNIFNDMPPDIFNHNLETVPEIYHKIRPGANYAYSLKLLKRFKEDHPEIPTKSGLMVGLGEKYADIINVMHDLRSHGVTMITIGQYLQPSRYHLPVRRYVSPDEFAELQTNAQALGFTHAACSPLVRSSYHADKQAEKLFNN